MLAGKPTNTPSGILVNCCTAYKTISCVNFDLWRKAWCSEQMGCWPDLINYKLVKGRKMKNTDKDDYKVCFSGATISKREANKAGVALLFGFIGIVTIGFAFGIRNKLTIS